MKLTKAKVIQIRELHAARISRLELARQFAISARTIGYVLRRISWKHVK